MTRLNSAEKPWLQKAQPSARSSCDGRDATVRGSEAELATRDAQMQTEVGRRPPQGGGRIRICGNSLGRGRVTCVNLSLRSLCFTGRMLYLLDAGLSERHAFRA